MERFKVTVLAVIQARMTSSRFPGKVLAPLAGLPVLGHIVSRLRRSKYNLKIILATSVNAEEAELIRYAESLGLEVVRGPEKNVLERYRLIRERYDFEYLVSICGDSPLVEASCVDFLLDEMIQAGADYAKLKLGSICIHEGIDPISKRGICKLLDGAAEDPIAQEHVNGYFQAHPEFCQACEVSFPEAEQFEVRLSVDTPADLKFLEALYLQSGCAAGELAVTAIPALLVADSSLSAINSQVRQKSVEHAEVRVLIRCDGGAQIGWGHVIRCLSIADALREEQGAFVQFLTQGDAAVLEQIRSSSFRVTELDGAVDESEQIAAACESLAIDVLFLDIRTGLSRSAVERLRWQVSRVVVFDDASERRWAADVAIYPPAPQVAHLDWTGFVGELLAGWEYVPLRKAFSQTYQETARERILVSFGGSDPEGSTMRILQGLVDAGVDQRYGIDVLIGPSCQSKDALLDRFGDADSKVQLHIGRSDVWNLMRNAKVALCSFGVVSYELVSQRVPQLIFCRTEDDLQHASIFSEHNLGQRYSMADMARFCQVAEELAAFIDLAVPVDPPSDFLNVNGCSRIAAVLTGK